MTKAIASTEACITLPMVSGVVPSVILSGFSGLRVNLNGAFRPTGSLSNGKLVYSKDADEFLHYNNFDLGKTG